MRREGARAEQLERSRRTRIDLDHPGVTAIPDRVDPEGAADPEAGGDLAADGSQPAVKLGQLAVGQSRRRDVSGPLKAPRA